MDNTISDDNGTADISPDEFRVQAAAWLGENRQHAPRDYGAICPPDLIEAGVAWQQRLFAAGFAGIHWPREHGGRGLTVAHQRRGSNSARLRGCRRS